MLVAILNNIMDKEDKRVITDLLSKRTDFIKLVFAAIILAIGTALLANYFTSLFVEKSFNLFLAGFIPTIMVIFYFGYTIIAKCENILKIQSLLVFDEKTLDSIKIDRYSFSEDINKVFDSVFLENNAIKNHWLSVLPKEKKEETSKKEEKDKKTNNPKEKVSYIMITAHEYDPNEIKEVTNSDKILNECIEHVILEKISTHLSGYFNSYSSSDKYIKEYTRNDLPKILLENRITNLLSTPFEDRDIFSKFNIKKQEGEIISIYGSDGSQYSRFDLTLPTKTIVTRTEDGKLKLENNRVKVEINIKNDGFSTSLPRGFEFNYLGRDDKKSVNIRKIDIEIKTFIKPLTLLFGSGWQYHKWIDSLITELEQFASFDLFVDKINWESQLTNIIITNNRAKFRKEAEKKTAANN